MTWLQVTGNRGDKGRLCWPGVHLYSIPLAKQNYALKTVVFKIQSRTFESTDEKLAGNLKANQNIPEL